MLESHIQELQERVSVLVVEKREMEGMLEGVEEEVGGLVDGVGKLKDENEGLKCRVRELEDHIASGSNAVSTSNVPTVPTANVPTQDTPQTTQETQETTLLKKENTALKTQVKDLESELLSVQTDLKELVTRQREGGSLATQAVDQLDHELQLLKTHVEKVEERNDVVEKECMGLRELVKEKAQECEDVKRVLGDVKGKYAQKETEFDDLVFVKRQLESKVSQGSVLLESEKKERSRLEKLVKEKELGWKEVKERVQLLEREKVEWLGDVGKRNSAMNAKQDEIDSLVKQINGLQQECESLKEEVEHLTAHLNTQDRNCVELERKLGHVERESQQWQQHANVT
jgi:chromosome segregation ATPase